MQKTSGGGCSNGFRTKYRKARHRIAKYRTQGIERQNIEVAKYRSRKISKSQNIEVAKYLIAKYRSRKISKSQNIEVAKYRIAKYRTRKISNKQNIVLQNIEKQNIENAKYRRTKYWKQNIDGQNIERQNIEVAKYRKQNIEVAKYRKQNIEVAKYRKQNMEVAKYRKQNIEVAKYRTQNIVLVKYRTQNIELVKYRTQNIGNCDNNWIIYVLIYSGISPTGCVPPDRWSCAKKLCSKKMNYRMHRSPGPVECGASRRGAPIGQQHRRIYPKTSRMLGHRARLQTYGDCWHRSKQSWN